MILPHFCKSHDKPVTHVCLQSNCPDRLLCLNCNAAHNQEHHKRIYALNTAMSDNELTLLFEMVESKYSSFSERIDDKVEELIQSSEKSKLFNL